jgi:hypothetical protein
MDRLIAYCGLVCAGCPAYVATQANDLAELERVAAQWREQYNAPGLTAESVRCDACTQEGRHVGHWFECNIRVCAQDRGVANCAHCADYACEKLDGFFAMVPDARAVLDEVRQSLSPGA